MYILYKIQKYEASGCVETKYKFFRYLNIYLDTRALKRKFYLILRFSMPNFNIVRHRQRRRRRRCRRRIVIVDGKIFVLA